MKWKAGLLGVALAGLLISASASATTRPTVKASTGYPSTVTERLNGDYNCQDPYDFTCYTAPDIAIWEAMYQYLLVVGPGGKIIPYLASSWKVTGTKTVFTIQKGVTCSNGQKLDAAAVATVLTNYFAREAATGNNLVSTWGAAPYLVTGDNRNSTVTVQLSTPEPLSYANFLLIPIVCPSGLQPASQSTAGITYPPGSGPYEMVSATHGVGVTFRLRKGWKWGPLETTASELPKNLVYSEVTDETTAANELLTNQLQVASVSGPDIARLAANKSLNAFKFKSATAEVIAMNETPGHVTDDINVRKAIDQAINPKAYGSAAFGVAFTQAHDVVAPADSCYENNSKLVAPYSVSAAKATLVADGYTMGSNGVFQKNGQPLSLTVVSTPAGLNNAGEYLQSALNNIGINVNAIIVPYAQFAVDLKAGNWDVFTGIGGSGGGAPVPNASIYLYIGANGNDIYHADDATAYALEQTAAATVGCKGWKALFARLISNYDQVYAAVPLGYVFARDHIHVLAPPSSGLLPWSFRAG